MGVLGTGTHECWIYDRRGERELVPLERVSSVKWGRQKNVISTAEVSVLTGQHGDCCSSLGMLGTWGHSLVIFRNGQRVWEGPLTNIRWRKGGVSLMAHDVLGWSMRRKVREAYMSTSEWSVNQLRQGVNWTFAEDDPNVLAYVHTVDQNTGPKVRLETKANSGYYDDYLDEITKSGASYTTVGRRIVLWPSSSDVGRTEVFSPSKHLSGDVEVEEDGLKLSTQATFVNDEDLAGTSSGGLDPFYGLVQTLDSFSGSTVEALAESAQRFRDDHYPCPVRVNVPEGAVLSCDAPMMIEQLVPGVTVPVKIDAGLCRQVDATPELTAVNVVDDAGGEKVSITLGEDPAGFEGWMSRVEKRQAQLDRRIREL